MFCSCAYKVLRNGPVKVSIGGPLDVKGATANVVHSLVIQHDSHISVLQEGVGGENTVVGLHNGGGNLRRRNSG
jgi:hypothetical protein